MLPSFKKFRVNILSLSMAHITLACTKAQLFLRNLFSKKNLRVLIIQLYNPDQSDGLKAFSAAFGVFMGIIPVWGFQTLIAIFFAVLLKLNKSFVIIFSQVSFPPFMPLVIFLSYKTGQHWINNKAADAIPNASLSLKNINQHLEQYIYGSITLAIAAGIMVGLLTFVSLRSIKMVKRYKPFTKLKNTYNNLLPFYPGRHL